MRLTAIIVFGLLASTAWAQNSLLPLPPDITVAAAEPDPASLQAYGDRDKTCAQWTDNCRTCTRTDGKPACSNIGPACQPAAITCVRQVAAPAPTPAPGPVPPAPTPVPTDPPKKNN